MPGVYPACGALCTPGSGGLGEAGHLARAGEALERLVLNATHPLRREPELPAGLAQGGRVVPVDAVAQLDHLPLLVGERPECAAHRLFAQADLDLLGRLALLAREEIAELGVPLLADRAVEACDRARGIARLLELDDRDVGRLRDLLIGRRAPQLHDELALNACDLALALSDVHRNADRAPLVR